MNFRKDRVLVNIFGWRVSTFSEKSTYEYIGEQFRSRVKESFPWYLQFLGRGRAWGELGELTLSSLWRNQHLNPRGKRPRGELAELALSSLFLSASRTVTKTAITSSRELGIAICKKHWKVDSWGFPEIGYMKCSSIEGGRYSPQKLNVLHEVFQFQPFALQTLQLCSTPYFMAYNLQNAHKTHYIQKHAQKRVQNLGNGDLK